jgi:G:T-mismatch repair DNA endonuclease (very short patch repair protein)
VIKNFWGRGQSENVDIDATKTWELMKLGNNYMHLILCNLGWSLSIGYRVEKIEGWNVMDGGDYIYLNTREAFPG